jgi:hypothetical protein
MPQHLLLHWFVAICFVLNGATVIALCIGWKLEDIVVDRITYLLGCAGVATILCLVQGLAICVHPPRQNSNNAWKVVAACAILEVALLSTFITLLYLGHSARRCLREHGSSHFCTIVVRTIFFSGRQHFF